MFAGRLVVTGMFVLAFCHERAVCAQATSPTADLLGRGIQARKEGRDAAALDLFLQAYQSDPSPRVLAQVGLAEEALERWVEAEGHLAAAMRDESDPWIQRHKAALDESLSTARAKVSLLDVSCNAERAELWLGGRRVGPLPLPAQHVLPGLSLVEVRADGVEAVRKLVNLEPGRSTSVVFHLSNASARSAAMVAPAVARPSPTPSPTPRRTLAWTLVALGGAFLIEAAVATVVRENALAVYNDDSSCLHGNLSREQRCGAYLGRSQVADVLAKVGFAAAAASVGGSTYFFLTSRAAAQVTYTAAF